MKFNEMVTLRRRLEAAEQTMVCFQLDGYGWAAVAEIRDSWVKQDRETSKRGGGLKARIRLNTLDRAALRNRAIQLGKMDDLTEAYAAAYEKAQGKKAPRNLGWVYECAVTERLGRQVWTPDRIPFWKAPDVVIDGIGYQVKGDGAEWFTEKSLNRALDEVGL